jgi:aquaporin TIP
MDRGLKSWVAEFIGTFTLCLAGQGAICAQQLVAPGESGLVAIALAHGLALVVMVTALGAVSGGHFNPAVTFGFVVTGRQTPMSGVMYWVSQLLGALAATALVIALFPDAVWHAVNAGTPTLNPNLRAFGGVIAELVMTFFLVTAVWGSAVDERHPPLGGLIIGLTVTLDILFGGPLTGAAMNPARAFGAAALSGTWGGQWIYWVGPLLGGALAAWLYQSLMLERRAGG